MRKTLHPYSLLAGGILGLGALLLTALGNPVNMGLCIACFLRDITGALGFHTTQTVQYFRPEIGGLVLGAMTLSLLRKEFRPKAGSSPVSRFVLGSLVMIGALAFLGCPTRLLLRLGGGDGNALVGLAGFVAGISIGVAMLKRGFSLKRSYTMSPVEGGLLPLLLVMGTGLALVVPGLFQQSTTGPGASYASGWMALVVAFVVGMVAQRGRLCTVGSVRDVMLFGDTTHLQGIATALAVVTLGNVLLGNFHPSFALQPIAHSDFLWNFLGMVLVGWCSVLLGGCPMRQLILAGEGNGDSAITLLGMVFGAALAHNYGLAASPDSVSQTGELVVGGVSTSGATAVVVGLVLVSIISLWNLPKIEKTKGAKK